MFKLPSTFRRDEPRQANGFTLVEMLVAVTLVLLMMSMFAQVFVMSTGSLSQQRGIAENDQRARLLTMTIRGDLDARTFRDVLPFRANEDTRQLGHSLARRAGYLEIDEGVPSDDGDDVLTFTASVNIHLQGKDASPFVGKATSLSRAAIASVASTSSITVNGDITSFIAAGSQICIAQSDYNNGCFSVVGSPSFASGVTTITLNTTLLNTLSAQTGIVCISPTEPEGDDGVFGNGTTASAFAEVCYFLRNGILYRRTLLIRDTPPGVSAQPTWSTGVPIFWNNSNWNTNLQTENYSPPPPTGLAASTFWRDFDYSAFYYTGDNTSGEAPGVRFHNSAESLSNSSQSSQLLTNYSQTITPSYPLPLQAIASLPFSLGIPHWRFGHSTSNGLPQDASAPAKLNGNYVSIGRFNLQECSNTNFGYPGHVNNGNPFDNQSIDVNPVTGLVTAFESQIFRRGEDILLSNVLSFDVKVWDEINGLFVDVGNTTSPNGPFSSQPNVIAGTGVITDDGTKTGVIVGGRLNSTYGSNDHYRFDTWHPNASITTKASSVTGSTFYNEPPYYQPPPYYTNNPSPSAPYTYNEPPYVPVARNPSTSLFHATPLAAIQITISFRDVSSNQIRQVTIVQSLIDQVKQTGVTNQVPEE